MFEVVAKRHEGIPFMSVWLTMSRCENVAKSECENVCENAYFIWTFLVECSTLYMDLHKVILNCLAFSFLTKVFCKLLGFCIVIYKWLIFGIHHVNTLMSQPYINYSPLLCPSYVGFNHLTN